jgi:hypothetical protein
MMTRNSRCEKGCTSPACKHVQEKIELLRHRRSRERSRLLNDGVILTGRVPVDGIEG